VAPSLARTELAGAELDDEVCAGEVLAQPARRRAWKVGSAAALGRMACDPRASLLDPRPPLKGRSTTPHGWWYQMLIRGSIRRASLRIARD
jgi:hypothetical protein